MIELRTKKDDEDPKAEVMNVVNGVEKKNQKVVAEVIVQKNQTKTKAIIRIVRASK